MTLATNIRTARGRKGITQRELALMARVSAEYIKKLESGRFKPRIAVYDIAKALNTTVEELIDG